MILEYYSASWCQPCKVFGPVMDAFASDHPEMEYIKVNIDITPEKALAEGITGVPTIILKDGEKEVYRLTGAKPRPFLDKNVATLLK